MMLEGYMASSSMPIGYNELSVCGLCVCVHLVVYSCNGVKVHCFLGSRANLISGVERRKTNRRAAC